MNYTTSKQLIENTKNFLKIKNFIFSLLVNNSKKVFYGWGRKKSGLTAIELAKKYNSSFVLLEDGFIRSLGLGVNGSPIFSLVEDNIGIYYDATSPSKLEDILNNYDFKLDNLLMQRANEAMTFIKEHNISKYNNAPLVEKDFFSDDFKPKVLVVAQTFGDASLEYGLGNLVTTQQIIEDAINQNPNATVYIKIHPDVLSGKKDSDIKVENIPKECKIIDEDVNPISLLKHFDKVYTKTSGMGMEALILGKEVHCYGMPYYAGWGLTVDKQTCSRRVKKLTIEELFAGSYILYTKYYNPYRDRASDILDTMKEIVLQRKKIGRATKNKILALGDSHIRVFEHTYFKYLMPQFSYEICYVPGATAYGIGNLHSQTNAYKIFLEMLEKYNYEEIVVTLGEVDCAYTLWNLAEKTGKPMDTLLELSVERYKIFLNTLTAYAPVKILSSTFPTVSDVAECDDSISGIRKKISISQKERTQLVLKFNEQIKVFVESQVDMQYFDFNSMALDTKTGTVKYWLLNKKNICDHHYKRPIYVIMIVLKMYYNRVYTKIEQISSRFV